MAELGTDILLTGTVMYCRPYQPDQFGNWSTRLYMDQATMDLVMGLKVKNTISRDEAAAQEHASKYHITLRRRLFIEKKDKAGNVLQKIPLAPLVIVDKNEQPFQQPIGDGSKVTCKCEYYGGEFAGMPWRAIRWKALMVHELIPFIAKTAEITTAIEGMAINPPRQGW